MLIVIKWSQDFKPSGKALEGPVGGTIEEVEGMEVE